MVETEAADQGRRLLNAVERILADNAALTAYADECLRNAGGEGDAAREAAMRQAVRRYSNLAAVSGGAAALPAVVPGLGSLLAATGGTLADMALMLKFEVEMALVLSHLGGYDIADERERQLAFLLVAAGTHDARAGGNFFVDLAKTESTAIWNYAPRELSKLVLFALGRLLLLFTSKGLLRALPLVGIGIGASVNKVLTRRVGERCIAEIRLRRQMAAPAPRPPDVVEARVRPPRRKK